MQLTIKTYDQNAVRTAQNILQDRGTKNLRVETKNSKNGILCIVHAKVSDNEAYLHVCEDIKLYNAKMIGTPSELTIS